MMKDALEQGTLDESTAERLNEGKDFYFYHNTDNIKHPGLIKLYFAYEVIFRMLPIMPAFIRKRIKPQHVIWIPKPIAITLLNVADLLNCFWWNMEVYAYFRYYITHTFRFASLKLKKIFPRVIKQSFNNPKMFRQAYYK